MSIYMILHFQIDFNNIDPTSLQKYYDEYVSKHLPHFSCPNSVCTHEHRLMIHSVYNRYVFLDSETCIILKIIVLMCPDCGTHHAVLPSFVLPFSSYSYPFIMHTLMLFFFGSCKGNKTKVCSIMNISRKVLNHFLFHFTQEDVRVQRRSEISSSLLDLIKNPCDKLEKFIYDYFIPDMKIIFLRTPILRYFHVNIFAPPNKWDK